MQEHFEEHQNQINPTNSHWCSLGHQVRFTVHKTHSGMKCLPLENWTEFICLWNKDYSSSIFAIQKQTHICLYKRKICKKYRIVSTLTGIHVKIGIKATSKLKKKKQTVYFIFMFFKMSATVFYSKSTKVTSDILRQHKYLLSCVWFL